MNHRDPNHELLHDIFVDATSPDFRSALLDDTLRRVRQKRRMRRVIQGTAMSAAIGLFALFSRQIKAPLPSHTAPDQADFRRIETQALASACIVHTGPFARDHLVETVAFNAQVQTVNTRLSFRLINDRELLALAGEGRAALVRIGPHEQELIIVDPEDAKGLSPR